MQIEAQAAGDSEVLSVWGVERAFVLCDIGLLTIGRCGQPEDLATLGGCI